MLEKTKIIFNKFKNETFNGNKNNNKNNYENNSNNENNNNENNNNENNNENGNEMIMNNEIIINNNIGSDNIANNNKREEIDTNKDLDILNNVNKKKLKLIKVSYLVFDCERFVAPHAIRGYIGWIMNDDVILHNHILKNKMNYNNYNNSYYINDNDDIGDADNYNRYHTNNNYILEYPVVQYKLCFDANMIMGFNEGIVFIKKIFNRLDNYSYIKDETRNINERVEILNKLLLSTNCYFGESDKMINYKFIHPWIPLNNYNYEMYTKKRTEKEKKEMLQYILTNNIISIFKKIKYPIPRQNINIELNLKKDIWKKYKNSYFLGFLGEFSTNVVIPNYFGLGKSVSKGFGTIVNISNDENSYNINGFPKNLNFFFLTKLSNSINKQETLLEDFDL